MSREDCLPGDIVLYPVSGKDGWESRIVGIGQLLFGSGRGHEQFSHAALLSTTPGWEWEAKWPRVGHFEIDQSRDYEVRRPREYTEEQRRKVLAWFAAHKGNRYDLACLFTFGLIQLPNAEVCSQAVDRALLYAGNHPDLEGKHILSPDALADFAPVVIYRHRGV
jgi:hypothetical protein